jgi:hypothetical protein
LLFFHYGQCFFFKKCSFGCELLFEDCRLERRVLRFNTLIENIHFRFFSFRNFQFHTPPILLDASAAPRVRPLDLIRVRIPPHTRAQKWCTMTAGADL